MDQESFWCRFDVNRSIFHEDKWHNSCIIVNSDLLISKLNLSFIIARSNLPAKYELWRSKYIVSERKIWEVRHRQTDGRISQKDAFSLVKCIRKWANDNFDLTSIHFWQRYAQKTILRFRSQWPWPWPLTFRPQICSPGNTCPMSCFHQSWSFYDTPISSQSYAQDGRTDRRTGCNS